ncbi:C45 family autoproteolytic acyltransferase/hydolase [Streptomyces cinereospinus]|uniref:C45 family autoproteolytic acyltransferase/hydrolase n=1 Tax=Streptomyces cinereospinus TaxID=285561 RepID=A0ABV5MXE6_9ACTN
MRQAGGHFAMGRQHGAARAAALRAFLDDGTARLAHLMTGPVSWDGLRAAVAGYRAETERQTPDLAAEVRGLAAGADLSEDEAWLLQSRRELLGYHKVPTLGDCTTYARAGEAAWHGPVLAQTVDLNGDLDDVIAVLDVAPAGGRRVLVLSFGGLLGYLGVNEDGLAVGINLVLGGDWRPGLPPYLAVRHLLERAGTVAEALDVLAGLRLASSRSLTLCDPRASAWVEVLGDDIRAVRSDAHVHTNHFLHPDFAARDELNVFARNSSLRRREACLAALERRPGADPEEHFAVLSAPPVCVSGTGDIRRERTVAAAVMLPARRELRIRPGDPSRAATQVFRLT